MSAKRHRLTTLAVAAAAACMVAGMSRAARADITVDGTLDNDYGAPLAIGQNVTDTDSTASNGTSIDYAAGSEIDATYVAVENGNLYAFFAGNLGEGQRIDIFVQTGTGGMNVLTPLADGSNPGNYYRLTGASTGNNNPGVTFDSGFAPNYFFSSLNYPNGAGPGATDPGIPQIYTDDANLNNGGTGGQGTAANPDGNNFFNPSSTFPNLEVTFNNSNTGGVTTTTTTGQTAVTTGVEFEVPLADITETGQTISSIELTGLIADNNQDTVYNQITGLPSGTADLGDPSYAANFNNIAGPQYVTLALPEPASLGLLGLGGLTMVRRRRSR